MKKENCDIRHAQETGLHLLAKKIIQENHRILLPGWTIAREDVYSSGSDASINALVDLKMPSTSSVEADYEWVENEKRIGDMVADAVIMIKDRPCIVEVAVTHFVDQDKKGKAKDSCYPMFEIDLSDLVGGSKSREEITEAILSDKNNRKWIYNLKLEETLSETQKEYTRKYKNILALKKREETIEERKKREREKYKEYRIEELKEMFSSENYAYEVKQLRNDEKAMYWLSRFDFSKRKGTKEYPFYMDIPITGEFVFSCDRRIWQGKIFEDYIYNGFRQDLCIFTIGDMQRRISKGDLIVEYDKRYTYRTKVLLDGREKEISLSYDVIERYMEYLGLLGFASYSGYNWYSRRPKSLDPPDSEAAEILKAILKSVDLYDPNIDTIIEREYKSRSRALNVAKES